ncbi:MAG: subclass B3 metallo-beta-lactamase [Pseudomonadota bacterium]
MAARVAAIVLLASCTGVALAADAKAMNQPHKPFQIYGNTYYVGTEGISSILIVSDYGSVLIDGGYPESARQIAANIATLGFKITDVKAILSSHPHADHAGGIAELAKLSGAQVYASRAAEPVLLSGKPSKDDPQFKQLDAFPKIDRVWIVQDDQLLGVGNVRVRALATPGHTAGGMSWSWDACDGSKCLSAVFADSLSAVSDGKYKFKDHPDVLKSFDASFTRLEGAACELLVTAHPEASGGLARLEQAGASSSR